jgi:hypothetical protein
MVSFWKLKGHRCQVPGPREGPKQQFDGWECAISNGLVQALARHLVIELPAFSFKRGGNELQKRRNRLSFRKENTTNILFHLILEVVQY